MGKCGEWDGRVVNRPSQGVRRPVDVRVGVEHSIGVKENDAVEANMTRTVHSDHVEPVDGGRSSVARRRHEVGHPRDGPTARGVELPSWHLHGSIIGLVNTVRAIRCKQSSAHVHRRKPAVRSHRASAALDAVQSSLPCMIRAAGLASAQYCTSSPPPAARARARVPVPAEPSRAEPRIPRLYHGINPQLSRGMQRSPRCESSGTQQSIH